MDEANRRISAEQMFLDFLTHLGIETKNLRGVTVRWDAGDYPHIDCDYVVYDASAASQGKMERIAKAFKLYPA